MKRPLALAATMLALLPASALAQSAGDEQYSDPFGSATPQPKAAAAPAPAAPATSQPATAAQAAPATTPAAAPAQQAQLPRTGADAVLVALAGALLLATGAALRLRLRAE
jgi:LPXTG-motif cell wall-anchored protein